MTTAFVLSGGGSLGAVQVGMLQALAARGVEPDVLIGTSAGALNAAFVAGHGVSRTALDRLESVWRTVRRKDVFPLHPVRLAAGAAGRAPSLFPNDGIRALIRAHVRFGDLEDAPIPIHVVATDVTSGEEVLLSRGDAVDAVLASTALPAVFPAVEIGGRYLVDGGVADNAAVSQAVALGADVVYVLPTGFACALTRPPANPLASALQALTLLIEQRLLLDVRHYAGRVELHVMPPLCPLAVSSADFRHGAELVARARAATERWLVSGRSDDPDQARYLSLHRHRGGGRSAEVRQEPVACQ